MGPPPALNAPPRSREQTRARYPDATGYAERDGIRIFWERYGDGEPTVLLLPTWSLIHSRFWKAQIPYLARHCRVLTFDGRGNGRSDRPVGAEAYTVDEFAADALAVMDATATESAALVGLSCGALWGTMLAAEHPERVARLAYICPAVPLAPQLPERRGYALDEPLATDEGWAKYNTYYWQRAYDDFVEFFVGKLLSEPHMTKPIEDVTGWAHETTPETLGDATRGMALGGSERWRELFTKVLCPTLVIHGDHDMVRSHAQGAALAEATGGQLVTIEGGGHLAVASDPVRVNVLLRDFLCPAPPAARWPRAHSRSQRALYISSPIGLGHARRDLAIARELRRLRPGLQIDWLAQDPVSRVLEEAGEHIHPASSQLASESAHFQAEADDGHELRCFEAFRRMDEILLANFMVFHDVVRDEPYDLWIGDEAWDLDHFLHENPELKTARYAWLTDFVGFLPMPDGGEREASLTADRNAEMIEQIAQYPGVRDRAVFVGAPEDIIPGTFGPGLPPIRDWTEQHYSFSGYITGFDASSLADRDALRGELGYASEERVCLVAVGGSGVGTDLLRRVIAAYPEARRQVPGLTMVVVAGPRIKSASLPASEGVKVLPYVRDLHRHLAACDVAVVQGGLTTTMELTANRRPFLYFPLRGHFEQNLHVAHRLDRYRAGRRMDFDVSPPEAIATAIAEEIDRDTDYCAVEPDGAARAAALIAELL
jgi:pimeloyl-ACP methyl ester carboxylesterase/predicted glycosyltransferase